MTTEVRHTYAEPITGDLRSIIEVHVPAWLDLFERKNREYGDGAAFDLGARGQFSDMYRKMLKLKRAMWDEDESVLTTEGVDEILQDLIGHCFLTLNMRSRDRSKAAHPSSVNIADVPQPTTATAAYDPNYVSVQPYMSFGRRTRRICSLCDQMRFNDTDEHVETDELDCDPATYREYQNLLREESQE